LKAGAGKPASICAKERSGPGREHGASQEGGGGASDRSTPGMGQAGGIWEPRASKEVSSVYSSGASAPSRASTPSQRHRPHPRSTDIPSQQQLHLVHKDGVVENLK
jgi:hypothetical protein